MKVSDLMQLAHRYLPRRALSQHILFQARWGAAHELAHALLATPEERRQKAYGLDKKACDRTYALVTEAAAMRISFRLHRACGEPSLVELETSATDDEPFLYFSSRETIQLMRDRGCLGVPRSLGAFERFCRERGLRVHSDDIYQGSLSLFRNQISFA